MFFKIYQSVASSISVLEKINAPKAFNCTIVLLLIVVMFSGCATWLKSEDPIPFDEEIIAEVNNVPTKKYEGSLWQDNGPLSELFMNPKARRVGDTVTINIVEIASATNEADTNTSKNTSISAQITKALGFENNTNFPTSDGFNPFGQLAGTTANTFKGAGSTNRSGSLAASITARVTKVLPNGNMKIFGRREITINDEKQYLVLSGIIRSWDISSNNVVLSTYISDAKIAYTGKGVVNDRQNPGWLARVIDAVWPF